MLNREEVNWGKLWAILEGNKGTMSPQVDPLNSRLVTRSQQKFVFSSCCSQKAIWWVNFVEHPPVWTFSVCGNSNVNTTNQVKVEFRPFFVSPSIVKYTLNINNRQVTNLLAFQMFSFNGLHLSKVKNVKKRYHTKEFKKQI